MGEGYRGKRHRGTDGPQRLTASKAHSEVLSAENWGTPMPQKNKEESGEEDTRKKKVKRKCSVVSNSLRPQGLQPTRLLRPWDSPGKNTSGLPLPSLQFIVRLEHMSGFGKQKGTWYMTVLRILPCRKENIIWETREPWKDFKLRSDVVRSEFQKYWLKNNSVYSETSLVV